MSLLHLHLLLNHVPVVGVIGSLLLLSAALITRSRDLVVAGSVGLILCAAIAFPVFFTGEPAEEGIEGSQGVSEPLIDRHEDAALQAFVAIEIVAALALTILIMVRLRSRIPFVAVGVTLAVALVATVLIARTAMLGGEIRHTEIRSASAGNAEGNAAGHGETDDHD